MHDGTEKMEKRRKRVNFFLRLYALAIVILVAAILFFAFRYRRNEETSTSGNNRKETCILKISDDYFKLNDPSIPARGDSGVGFPAISFAEKMQIDFPFRERPVKIEWDKPAVPEIPLPTEEKPADPETAEPDFSVSAPLRGNGFSIRRGDGSLFSCGNSFSAIPEGKPFAYTLVRVVPVGKTTKSRFFLLESCGDEKLDEYALGELAKIHFFHGDVLRIDWGMEKK